MTTPHSSALGTSKLVLVMVALVAGAVAGAGLPDLQPNHVGCKLVQVNNHPNLFLGDPGADQAQPAVCELWLFSAKSDNFIKLNWRQYATGAKLMPWPAGTNANGAFRIPVQGHPAFSCHLAGEKLVPGGNRQCRSSLWQLSPSSAGVAIRLTLGSHVTSYTLRYASLPAQAQPIPR